ncbi:leucine-rich repeat domain-containing protein, partial [Blautia glucerasea]|uniref:leucine-rich repeat domain-containing protein n=1 Tax=Blautia glucerasea TaxID=536633 RepID=UPI001D06272D
FLGETPPSASYSWNNNIFADMAGLKTVYVPKGAYKAYSDAYRENLPETVRIKETGGDDFIVVDGEVTGYTGDSTEVTIPEGVTKIGASAFKKSQIQKITIPAEVTEIGENAFQGSTALQEVVFSGENNVAEIGSYAFSGCGELTGFSFGENLTEIKEHTFESC